MCIAWVMMGLMLPSSAAVTAGCEQAHVVLACDKKG